MTNYTHGIQDIVKFNLSAEKVVVNKTVKLVAVINAIMSEGRTEENLRTEIRATMKGFIDVDWQYSGIKRSNDDSGFERVILTASVRVDEKENYDLENRMKLASKKGLSITNITADTSVPLKLIEEAESELRDDLITKVEAEMEKLKTRLNKAFRINSLVYSSIDPNQFANNRNNLLSNKVSYGGGFDADDDSLGNASKITMRVEVTLASLYTD